MGALFQDRGRLTVGRNIRLRLRLSEKLAVSIQEQTEEDNREQRRDQRTAPRQDIIWSELIVKEIVMTTIGIVNKQV
jgi:hypothetical protein